ncbi:hypothetical protein Mapa_015795 [Marchantia paleacea]|nr:hypothetical protein Mapa_015795 [Marchantia paleacea]
MNCVLAMLALLLLAYVAGTAGTTGHTYICNQSSRKFSASISYIPEILSSEKFNHRVISPQTCR